MALGVAYLNGTYTPEELKDKGYWGMACNQAKFLKEGKEYVAKTKDLGLTTLAWTVNKSENMQALLELGVDYIITDYPK